MDWLEDGTQPKIGDMQELYEYLWGQKPAIQLPEMGDPEPPTTTAYCNVPSVTVLDDWNVFPISSTPFNLFVEISPKFTLLVCF